jgi:hypothetical protein
LPWDNRVFRGKERVRETAKAYKIHGLAYRLTPETDLDFRGS